MPFSIHVVLMVGPSHCTKKQHPPGNHHASHFQKCPIKFPGHNHLLTTDIDDPILIIKVKGHQYRWLAGGYDLEIGHL